MSARRLGVGRTNKVDRLSGSAFSAVMMQKAPSGYWRLGEASGSTMFDSSGNIRHGSYTSVTLGQTSLIGTETDTAGSFDGSASVGVVPYASWMNAPSAVSGYIVCKPTLNDARMLINRDDGGSRVWQFGLTSSKLNFITIGGTAGVVVATSPGNVNTGAVQHLGFTFDGSNIRLYVAGVKVQTAAAAGTVGTAPADINIGRRQASGTNSPFQGIIDDCALWMGVVLTDTDFADLYSVR